MLWKARYLVVLVALTLALSGCGSKEDTAGKKGAEVITKPVAVVTVATGEVTRVNTITGKVAASMEVNVVPKLGGKVAEVQVQVGDRVQAGQVLVRLDTTEIAAQVKQAEAGLETARANLEQTEQVKQAVQVAKAQHQAAKDNLERMEYLYGQGAISQAQLDGARTQFQVAEAQLAQAEANLKVADVARAQVLQAEAALELARAQLNNSAITAPIGGVVSTRYIDPGEMAAPTMPVVTIVQVDTVAIEASVTEDYINRLQVGQEVKTTIKVVQEEPFAGKVASVSPAADARTRAYNIKIDLPNPEGALKPGMTAAIPLALESQRDVLVVPVQAVLDRGGKKVVFVVESGVAKQREVTVGLEGEKEVAITAGLSAGEQVVVSGQHLLSDGDRVTLPEGGKG